MDVFTDSDDFLAALETAPTGFDVRDLVCTAVEACAPRAKSRQLRLKRSVDLHLPHELHGDSIRLGTALVALVANAVEHTPRGEICLTAAIEDESFGEVTVRFTVSSPFGRLSGPATAELCNRFEPLGGEITVEHLPGRGAAVSLVLPLLRNPTGRPAVTVH